MAPEKRKIEEKTKEKCPVCKEKAEEVVYVAKEY